MNYSLFVGVDESDQEYILTVLAADGSTIKKNHKVVLGSRVIFDAVDWLRDLAKGESMAVAFEKPDGAFQDYLLELAIDVFALNPIQTKSLRGRYRAEGSSDPFDSYVLADSLRTDTHQAQFRPVGRPDEVSVRLKTLTRTIEQLKQNLRRETNRLRARLHRTVPQLLTQCNGADEPWLWDLLSIASTPEKLARLTLPRLTKLLKRHRKQNVDVATLHSLLRQPAMPVADGVVEATEVVLRSQIPLMTYLHQEIKLLEAERNALVVQLEKETNGDRPSDAAIVDSIPGIGTGTTAVLLAYCGVAIRERDFQHLRSQTGVAPVSEQSGASSRVHRRYACSGPPRNAMFHAANVAVQQDDYWRAQYALLRYHRKSHAHALRNVGNSMLRVLVAMLLKGELYDAKKRRPRKMPTSRIEALLAELDEVEEASFPSINRRKPKRKAPRRKSTPKHRPN
jgi:transposase